MGNESGQRIRRPLARGRRYSHHPVDVQEYRTVQARCVAQPDPAPTAAVPKPGEAAESNSQSLTCHR